MKPIFNVYYCRKLTDLDDRDFPPEEPREDCLYYLALIQQEADQKAAINRRKWRVFRGGKSATGKQISEEGQQLSLFSSTGIRR